MATQLTDWTGAKEAPNGSLHLDRAEHLELYKFKILNELRDEIWVWARGRIGFAVTVISLLITIGSLAGISVWIKFLVDQQVERIADLPVSKAIKQMDGVTGTAQQKLAEVQVRSDDLSRASRETLSQLAQARTQVVELDERVKKSAKEVQDVQELAKALDASTKTLGATAREFKDGNSLAARDMQSQLAKARSIALLMRNDVELLQSGFVLIEKLAGEIRQKDPQSELARQFAGFGKQWRDARDKFERQAMLLKSRRNTKVIHYLRGDASDERKAKAKLLESKLLDEGYVVETWYTKARSDNQDPASEVEKDFGVKSRTLRETVMVKSPKSKVDLVDLRDVARRIGAVLPTTVRESEMNPTVPEIQEGAEGGKFASDSIILIAELDDD